MNRELRLGLILAAASYFWWGFAPLFFKALSQVSSLEVLCHRVIWSAFMLSAILAFKNPRVFLNTLRRPDFYHNHLLASVLVSINWLVFIYAIVTDRILESSLGYFINPILTVILGLLFFKERLTSLQKASFFFAVLGLIVVSWSTASVSWIALALPLSFGFYGLLRKKSKVDSLTGLAAEVILITPLALAYLWYLHSKGTLAFGNTNAMTNTMLIACGPWTAIPLLLFSEGARRVPYNWMGFLQYINPTMQFLFGVLVFHEPLHTSRLIGFVLVWLGLVILLGGTWKKRI